MFACTRQSDPRMAPPEKSDAGIELKPDGTILKPTWRSRTSSAIAARRSPEKHHSLLLDPEYADLARRQGVPGKAGAAAGASSNAAENGRPVAAGVTSAADEQSAVTQGICRNMAAASEGAASVNGSVSAIASASNQIDAATRRVRHTAARPGQAGRQAYR